MHWFHCCNGFIGYDLMNPFDKGREVSAIEVFARICMDISKETDNIWRALMAHNCALKIRNMAGYTVYEDKL